MPPAISVYRDTQLIFGGVRWKASVLYVFVPIARSRKNAKFATSVIPALENMRKVNVIMVGLNQIIKISGNRRKGKIMAKWNVAITEDRIVRTLFFMEKVFEEVWEEDSDGRWGSKTIIDQEVAATFPIMDTEIANIIEELTGYDEDEVVEAMDALTEYEREVRL